MGRTVQGKTCLSSAAHFAPFLCPAKGADIMMLVGGLTLKSCGEPADELKEKMRKQGSSKETKRELRKEDSQAQLFSLPLWRQLPIS